MTCLAFVSPALCKCLCVAQVVFLTSIALLQLVPGTLAFGAFVVHGALHRVPEIGVGASRCCVYWFLLVKLGRVTAFLGNSWRMER